MQTVKTKFGQMLNMPIPWRTVLQNIAAAVVSVVVLSWLRPRPLCIFFLALFFYWLYKTRCSFRIQLTTDSRKKYKILKKKIMSTKKDFPTLYFVCFATALGSIAMLGYDTVGIILYTSILIAIFVISFLCTFFEINRMYKEANLNDSMTTNAETNSDSEDSASEANVTNEADVEDDEDEEFVPETNKTNLAILEKASEITSPAEDIEDEDHSDDIPSELLIPDSIPEISENSTDEDDELIPVLNVEKPSTSGEPLTIASKIHFKKGHFKNDTTQSLSSLSSSSSEESLSKGLRFPDHTVVVAAAATKRDQVRVDTVDTATVSNVMLSNQLPNIIGGLAIKWLTGTGPGGTVATTSKPKEIELNSDSSQESEFEFLDHE